MNALSQLTQQPQHRSTASAPVRAPTDLGSPTMRRVDDGNTTGKRVWRASTRARIITDVALFAVLLALSAPTTTGLAVHEWLALPFIPIFLGHLITSWPWITAMARPSARPRGRPRVNRALDILLFVLMVTAVYSGFAISVEFLPSVGFDVAPRTFWLNVHAASATLLVPLVAAHLFLHVRWVRRHVLKRNLGAGSAA